MHSLIRHTAILATFISSLSATVGALAQEPAKASPFLPPASGSATVKGQTTYELAGMSVAGKATLLSITRVRDKRSYWVPVGQTVGEITAVSYDPKTDEATIRAEGQLLTISMRKSAVVSAPVSRQPTPTLPFRPATLPAVAIPPPPANSQEEKETEARMLVTDLLEIGQEQRRAYEEAQRQASGKAKSANGKPAGGNR